MAHYFDEYFTNDNIENFDWIRNPFTIEMSDLTRQEQEELAKLSCDRTLQHQFRQNYPLSGSVLNQNIQCCHAER